MRELSVVVERNFSLISGTVSSKNAPICLGELPEVEVETIIRHMPEYDATKTLDRVQMWCIGR